ncbi:type II secretion system protein GspL [Idiomarina baltica]|jgi:general secretion pathway protein L|uniref:Type II secretion system protein L n=1 Tax=Idiomarina baltica OS145 TaxID=314276 RepID=A0ABM9WKK6_9GAMM|nr:type II secretion system protein GspL [Idiomarina baltica]EAQ31406.1 Type II secretory pathway, component PulL [Idiomarina baltica OS145]MEC8926470.1 type II secretion system protein GspL [Pseudomonadota bacterium]
MQERLLIRLPASDAEPRISWLIWQPSGAEVIASGELNDPAELTQLTEQAKRCQVTLLCPGQAISMRKVTIPNSGKRHLDKLIPYALEDELADDIDSLHFAWAENGIKEGQIPVAVVRHSEMQQWQQWLAAAHLEADEWAVDYLMLPEPESEQQWTGVQIADDVLIRMARWDGLAVEQTLADAVVGLKQSEYPQTNHVVAYSDIALNDSTLALEFANSELPMVAFANQRVSLDIRGQRYAPKRAKRTLEIRWQPLAWAAGIALAVTLASSWVKTAYLNHQAEQLQQQAEALYKETFPNQTRIVNLRAQMRQQLQSLGIDDQAMPSALAMLDQLAPAFQQQPQLSLELLRYQDGALRMQAVAQNFSQFEAFQNQAQQLGFEVQQGALNNRGDGVAGTLTIAYQGGRS